MNDYSNQDPRTFLRDFKIPLVIDALANGSVTLIPSANMSVNTDIRWELLN